MKKLPLLLCTILLVVSSSFSFGQGWLWGKGGFGPLKSNDYASPVATDKNGDAYITGQYYGTIVFGNDTLTNSGDEAYLTKYNSSGTVIWAKQIIDSTGYSYGNSVATDKSGNIYITGYFMGTAYVGTFSLITPPNSYYAVFLIKYDANGTVLWAKQNTVPVTSANPTSMAYSVATDKMGNIFITGTFNDTTSFGNYTLTAFSEGLNIFLVKYDSSGNVLWAKQAVSDSTNFHGTAANSVTTDNYGNTYITGYFIDTISFGATKLYTSIAEPAGFLAKYSPSGSFMWAKQSTNGSANSYCNPYAVITDRGGYPYITGYFQDIVKFGNQTIYSPSAYSAFLTKYDTNGNAIWAQQSSPGWEGTGLSSDGINYIYMSGISYYSNPDTLKFHNYALSTSPWTNNASFVMKFDTMGYPICGSILNSLGYYGLNGVASDSTGSYVYTASTFLDTIDCGPDTLVAQGGGTNTFLGRWLNCNSADGVPTITAQNGILLYPNPSTGIFTFQWSGVSSQGLVEVYNMLGEKVYSANYSQSTNHYSLDLSNQPNGIYLYRVMDENGSLVGDGKMVIER